MDHKIEELAKVYLIATDDGWVVDPTTVDGYALDGYDTGAVNDDCECGSPVDCKAARSTADALPLPNGSELAAMLVKAVLDRGSTVDLNEFRTRIHAALGCGADS